MQGWRAKTSVALADGAADATSEAEATAEAEETTAEAEAASPPAPTAALKDIKNHDETTYSVKSLPVGAKGECVGLRTQCNRCLSSGIEENIRAVSRILGLYKSIELSVLGCFLAENRVTGGGRICRKVLGRRMSTCDRYFGSRLYRRSILLHLAILNRQGNHVRLGSSVELGGGIYGASQHASYRATSKSVPMI